MHNFNPAYIDDSQNLCASSFKDHAACTRVAQNGAVHGYCEYAPIATQNGWLLRATDEKKA